MRLTPKSLYLVVILLAVVAAGFLLNPQVANNSTEISVEAQFNHARGEGKPILVFYSSEYCQQCIEIKEMIAQLDPEYFEKVNYFYVDMHLPENRPVVRAAGVISVPTLVFYDIQGNRQVFLGVIDKEDLENRLDSLADTGSFYVK